MKTHAIKLTSALLVILSTSSINGQISLDPITHLYKVGGSSEIFIGYSTSGNTFTKQGVLDVPENLDNIVKKEDASQYKFMDIRKTASAAGDFNGDGADEVVCIRNTTSNGIRITIPLIGRNLLMAGEKTYELEELNTMAYTRIRICTGNFDEDREDEFAVCYGGPGETVRVAIFETDKDLNISLVDTYKEIAYYDHNFDISAGDMDGDGIDEIAMVRNEGPVTEADLNVNPPIFRSDYDIYILKYDTLNNEIKELKKANDLEIINEQLPVGDWWFYDVQAVNEMRIACGDLNIDGKDEIVVGWSFAYLFTYIDGYGYTADGTFLNTFNYTPVSGEFENVQNKLLDLTAYGLVNWLASQNVALSLKCMQLDNLGRDEVLINSSNSFMVLGSTGVGMLLEEKDRIVGSEGRYINLHGNEAFIVADLNPDTATMNFNKEVILLLSNLSCLYQLYSTLPDVPSLDIIRFDTISADTAGFADPSPLHNFPFGDVDIEISAMVAGDFDLENTDLYRIGTPDILPVSQLQYPLVIMNAPPVHFDVFNGISHDLCDAFLDDAEPAFSAMYYTKVENESTTDIEVNTSMGFSSEFKKFAMMGGNGFESTVRKNFELGNSFYQAQSYTSSIEEEKEVYTEDYVLYSALDYRYYKYPVYNESLEKIGDIAVLNPESNEFSSVWGSGNSWDHPGYVFNHEPGNIFSYRPYMNTNDFCTRQSDFLFFQFSRVPVTNTGNGTFKFTFENITTMGSSYSFSAGVGSDMFTKFGFEGTMGVNVGAFGIGGSIETDISTGVSNELSKDFSLSLLSNHSTRLSNAFQIDGRIGRLNENYDNVARYFITPYIYRSQSGALVLDYMVDLDENNKEWWVDNYGSKSDLAFILPWRYAVEKGSDNISPSKLQKTGEIRFYPPVVSPGDTVCIATRVHNYSLLKFENTLKVNYYLGDPENGGIELEDIYGIYGSSKSSTMDYNATEATLDFEDYLTFNWQVPDTITCSPRIYAVIDKDNEYAEIHEDNNTGWNKLNIIDCAACNYPENYIGVKRSEVEPYYFETYPTPVSEYSRIHFSLPASENVLIEVYNLSGQKVATVTDAYYPQGLQEVEFYTGALNEGLYFYKLTVREYTATIRLFVLKD